MKQVSVTRIIAAPPETVWKHLTDKAALTSAGTGITRIDGTVAAQSRFTLFSEVAPGRGFAITVSTFVPPTRMVWDSAMPLGLFRGHRVFDLTRDGDSTRFTMTERFSGPLLPLIWRTMPDLAPSFEQFAAALARLSEGDLQ